MIELPAPRSRPQGGRDEEVERPRAQAALDDCRPGSARRSSSRSPSSAARARGDALDHVLLVGLPGLRKTTLATIVREELRRAAHDRRAGARAQGRHGGDPHGLEARDVFFIDEIHRVNRAIEEILYPALEDFRLDIVVGQGAGARTLTLDLPPFTLVGATTRTGLPDDTSATASG